MIIIFCTILNAASKACRQQVSGEEEEEEEGLNGAEGA